MSNRASIFDEDDAPAVDLSDFKPGGGQRNPVDRSVMRELAEGRGFTSREPEAQTPPAEASPATAIAPVRRRRAARAPRSVQLNVRITAAHQARFIACLDQMGESVSQADGIELAIEKLEAWLREDGASAR